MTEADAQRVVFDRKHFQTVNENALVRQAAELNHNQYLEKIDQNLQTINLNVGTVLTAQAIIYDGLSNVNSALKNGRAVLQLGNTVADLINYSNQMVQMGRSEPYLLLFAEDFTNQMKARSVRLLTEVSGFVLKEGSNVLADYNSRDQLLRKITQELQLLVSLAYGAWKAMYWARERGILRSVSPFENFIAQDRQLVESIIRDSKYLK
ncbi:hypothetical protein [Pedobacter foliorum]|uniref:hypothetical protein n=1 Tax=Pedobacter foliorum TaxID=2739058 RepID=UPI001565ADE5|nr:hypothetical protein [Pedobacter foliorum]NRF37548.1 hypothetical protein [Pedobacter foliorum]